MIGTTLSHYKIIAKLGEGGMGVVYRARDTKLDREVALKVLPDAFTSDPERLARFEREAKVLASLNHPHIAAIHGLEEADGVQALVLELVEGETLAERIARGPVPLDEALPIARQIAEALEVAHGEGVIHRDLKPANVKVAEDSDGHPQVKVLDFGLAKALQPPPSSDDPGVSQSPTLTASTTELGVILGTPAYMAPEQVRGQPVDRRADIWAFGCVLWEMLTEQRPFPGDSAPETMGRVLERDPDWGALQADVGPSLRRLLRRCLQKDRRERLRHIGDARLDLLEAVGELENNAAETSVSSRGSSRAALLVSTILAATVAGFAVWSLGVPGERPGAKASRWLYEPPDGGRFLTLGGEGPWLPYPPIVLSGDGSILAYSASIGSEPARLWLRAIDELDALPVPGSEGARSPFFSPDGQYLGFWKDGALQRVPIDGGQPEKIADLPLAPRGVTWTHDGAIVFGGGNTGLKQVVAGGQPIEMTHPDATRGEQYHAWPSELPGGGIAFTVVTGFGGELAARTPAGEIRVLPNTQGASQPHYVDSGHLVFFRSGGLDVAPFDLSTSRLIEEAVPFVSDVLTGWQAGLDLGMFDISDLGDLVHFAANRELEENRIVLVDRNGATQALPGDHAGRYSYTPAVSPDGRWLAVTNRSDRPSGDVWIRDLTTGSGQRLTRSDRSVSIRPVWSTDGSTIYFASYNAMDRDAFDIYRMRPDGSDIQLVLNRPLDQYPVAATDEYLIFLENHPETAANLYRIPLEVAGEAVGLAATPAWEGHGSVSPDGRYLAYASNDSGQMEIYVRPMDGSRVGRIVSTNGGFSPRWSQEGDELFFLSLSGSMMAVGVSLEPSFRAGRATALFAGEFDREYDVIRAGPHLVPGETRFVMLTLRRPDLTQLVVSPGWGARLGNWRD